MLVSCLGSSFAESFNFVENRVCGRGPDEWFASVVVMRQIVVDGRLQRGDNPCPAGNPVRGRPVDVFTARQPVRH
jgi:hypothetical protein